MFYNSEILKASFVEHPRIGVIGINCYEASNAGFCIYYFFLSALSHFLTSRFLVISSHFDYYSFIHLFFDQLNTKVPTFLLFLSTENLDILIYTGTLVRKYMTVCERTKKYKCFKHVNPLMVFVIV